MTVNWKDYITADPEVLVGKPIIAGTRLSVDFILRLLAQGWTEQQLFDNYPHLTPESLRAVFAFMHECFADEDFVVLKKIA